MNLCSGTHVDEHVNNLLSNTLLVMIQEGMVSIRPAD